MMHRVKTALGLLFVLGALPLAAQQTTGKIEGTVSDQAGAPVANAQVFVVGTSFGAVTNDKGYYFVNNVPVGTYSLRAQFIGFAPGADALNGMKSPSACARGMPYIRCNDGTVFIRRCRPVATVHESGGFIFVGRYF